MPPKNESDCEKINKELNPKTLKCVNKCKPGKSRNADFRCTNTKTKTAKKTLSPAKPKASGVDCEKINKELNPKTRRCVNKCKPGESRNAYFRCTTDIGKIVFPVPAVKKSTITPKIAKSMLNLINDYELEGKKYQEKGINYSKNNTVVLHNLLYMHLIEKYGSECYVPGRNMFNDYHHFPGIFLMDTFTNAETKKHIYKQIKLILNCIKRIQSTTKEIIVIPLSVQSDKQGHANMLIYRKSLNVIEHFEPHGASVTAGGPIFMEYHNNKVRDILKTIVNKMNTINNENNHAYYQNNLTYIPPYDVCPNTMGLQRVEAKANYLISNEAKQREGNGFCVIWSFFWAEMVLLNPLVPTDDLRNYILDSLDYAKFNHNNVYSRLSTKVALKTRNVIRGYLGLLYAQITKILEKIAPGLNHEQVFEDDEQFNYIKTRVDFRPYIEQQFEKHNEMLYSDYLKPASKSFSSLSL